MTRYQLLVIDDDDNDALLVAATLESAGFDFSYHRVDNEAALRAALSPGIPDLVISDCRLSCFSADTVLRLLRDSGHDIPVILVSGHTDEETAVHLMREGARDFVPKNRLHRLAPAVTRELIEADGRRQRRFAEQALRESERHYRRLAEHAQDIIFRCELRPVATLTYLNPAVTTVTGYPVTDLLGPVHRFLGQVLDLDQRAQLADSWISPSPQTVVVEWTRADATVVWLEQRARTILDDSGTPIAVEGVLRDITERISAERERAVLCERAHQTERAQSLGRLAGGVAHNFNNALAVIHGAAAFLHEDLGSEHPSHADVVSILCSADRGAALTRQLLIFAGHETTQAETFDLNTAVREVADLVRRTVGNDIHFVCETLPRPLRVTMVRSRIEQILLNLSVNSRDALPDGGHLRVEVAATTVTVDQIGNPELPSTPGNYATLTVTDDGTGMPPEISRKAFEPFFTTKGHGKGVGLGLATTYGMVTECGGSIFLSSHPGSGAVVRVYLPEAVAERHQREITTAVTGTSGGGAILVVEDEDLVRAVVVRILTQNGYRVLAAASAVEAIELMGKSDVCISAVLTDVIMRGMSGIHLAERLRADRPDLPVVLMSGYTSASISDEPINSEIVHKPFNVPELLTALRGAIDGTPV